MTFQILLLDCDNELKVRVTVLQRPLPYRTNDGVIWLVMVRDSMPRKEMVQWLMNAFEAGHVGKTGVELVPVRAFRIDPVRPRGYLSIDAESFKFGPVQGQILPSKANLLTSS